MVKKFLFMGMVFFVTDGSMVAMEHVFIFHCTDCELNLAHHGLTSGALGHILCAMPFERRLKIRVLDVRDNRLDTLPDGIAQLVNLEVLKLDANPLEILPVVVSRFANLKVLSLALCSLQALSETIGQLVHLEVLDVSCNKKLRTLPETIGDLAQLRELNLFADVCIKDLPFSMYRLAPNLRELKLLGTALNENVRQLSLLHRRLPQTTITDRFSPMITEFSDEGFECTGIKRKPWKR